MAEVSVPGRLALLLFSPGDHDREQHTGQYRASPHGGRRKRREKTKDIKDIMVVPSDYLLYLDPTSCSSLSHELIRGLTHRCRSVFMVQTPPVTVSLRRETSMS